MGHFDASVAGSDVLHPYAAHAVAGAERCVHRPRDRSMAELGRAPAVL